MDDNHRATSLVYYKRKNNTGRDAVYPDLKNERTPLFLPLLHSYSPPRVIANAIWIWGFQEALTIKVFFSLVCYHTQKPSINSSYCLMLVLTERPVCSSGFSFHVFLPLFIYYYLFFFFLKRRYLFYQLTLHKYFPVSFPILYSDDFTVTLVFNGFYFLFLFFTSIAENVQVRNIREVRLFVRRETLTVYNVNLITYYIYLVRANK